MTRVLLIDDDPCLREILAEVLTRAGYAVAEAEEGAEALRALQRQAYDIVVTDLLMPGREGLETIQELRRLYPRLPIVAMSGGGVGSAEDYLECAQVLGATVTLHKPFDRQQILAAIEAAHLTG